MEKFRREGKNLNHLLGWAHARVLENLVRRHHSEAALADQFGDERYIREALKSMGHLELRQTPRAERNPAVAAASVAARHRFLIRLRKLGKEVGLELPKGSGEEAMAVARIIFLKGGIEKLAHVAKLHFALTKRLGQTDAG
jgi:ribonuclease HIII